MLNYCSFDQLSMLTVCQGRHGHKSALQAVREGTIYPHPLKTQNRGCCITFPLHGSSDESGEESLQSGSDDTDAGDTASLYSDYVVDEEQTL